MDGENIYDYSYTALKYDFFAKESYTAYIKGKYYAVSNGKANKIISKSLSSNEDAVYFVIIADYVMSLHENNEEYKNAQIEDIIKQDDIFNDILNSVSSAVEAIEYAMKNKNNELKVFINENIYNYNAEEVRDKRIPYLLMTDTVVVINETRIIINYMHELFKEQFNETLKSIFNCAYRKKIEGVFYYKSPYVRLCTVKEILSKNIQDETYKINTITSTRPICC